MRLFRPVSCFLLPLLVVHPALCVVADAGYIPPAESEIDPDFVVVARDRVPRLLPPGSLLVPHEGVTGPELKRAVWPEFPSIAIEERIHATVALLVQVQKNGKVKDVKVLHCDRPGREFESAAVLAAGRWKYRPARHEGKAVEAYLAVYIRFDEALRVSNRLGLEYQVVRERIGQARAEAVARGAFSAADDDHLTLPRLTHRVQPEYWNVAVRTRAKGRVILTAVVQEDGTTTDLQVIQCSAPGLGFEESAINAASQWVYSPGMKDGELVDVFVILFMDFSFN
jgi:TonB family protein